MLAIKPAQKFQVTQPEMGCLASYSRHAYMIYMMDYFNSVIMIVLSLLISRLSEGEQQIKTYHFRWHNLVPLDRDPTNRDVLVNIK